MLKPLLAEKKWIAGDVATEGWEQIPAPTTIPTHTTKDEFKSDRRTNSSSATPSESRLNLKCSDLLGALRALDKKKRSERLFHVKGCLLDRLWSYETCACAYDWQFCEVWTGIGCYAFFMEFASYHIRIIRARVCYPTG